ncbi:MAG: hypothetical protein JW959_06620 [Pirellulales bacterium]|nr:hypothetical protein [Pirellulales bacterium]
MTHSTPQFDELADLVWALSNDRLDAEGGASLQRLLESDAANRRVYLELMDQFALLEWESAERTVEAGKHGDLETAVSPLEISTLSPLPSPLSPLAVGGPLFSYMVATVVLCLMLLGAWAYKISHVRDQHYVDNSRRQTASGPSEQPELVFVGRITGMKDCRWSDPDTYTIVGASVPLDREYALASGLMEITYAGGAKVILEGPCTYNIESSAGGFLARGKLTAKIRTQSSKPKAQSSELFAFSPFLSPLFSVRTPTAVVTDLGTEFGVEVDENGDTTSHVFEGKIVVKAGIRNSEKRPMTAVGDTGLASGTQRQLKAGESIQVSRVRAGTHHDSAAETVRFTHPATPPKFVRRLYEPPKMLDLLDIVAGGNGLGNRRERGIDPTTGMTDPMLLVIQRKGDGQYHTVATNGLIDGVFLPKGGKHPAQLDSSGHYFDGFTRTSGTSGSSIWVRAAEISTSDQKKDRWQWVYSIGRGGQYMPDGRGLLCIHANAGITFDLAAMRKLFDGSRPARFRSVAALADAALVMPDKNPHGMVDLWLFVDGLLKMQRQGLGPQDKPVDINVKLEAGDRFLTIVVTDFNTLATFDWAIFGDPVLEMKPTDEENRLR